MHTCVVKLWPHYYVCDKLLCSDASKMFN
uniref:Uncharacterized protein n=1 Tax=Arundo donax TaxID=35708 RepID=A0A0A8ZQV4_ARUDO